MGFHPYWKRVPEHELRRTRAEFSRGGIPARVNPYYGIDVRQQEADARTGVMRDVLGLDEGDLDEDGHAFDGSMGACRPGLVVTAGPAPMDLSEWAQHCRVGELQELGDDQSLYGGGCTMPDLSVRLARLKRWGRPRRRDR